MFTKKEFAIVSNLGFISRKKFMLSWVEHEKVLQPLGQFDQDLLSPLAELLDITNYIYKHKRNLSDKVDAQAGIGFGCSRMP